MTSWVSLALCASTARAHDPFESFTTGRLRADSLELTITFAQVTALRLIDPELKARALTFQNFAAHQPRLEREGAALYLVTSGRKRLAAQKVAVELTDENDVIFKVTYARPAAGPVHFHAAFLKKLGEGYGGLAEVNDPAGNNLGWEQLMFDNPNFQVVIPASPAHPR